MSKAKPKRWDQVTRERVESPAEVENFLNAYEQLCIKHGLCLSHQDDQGAFIVTNLKVRLLEWVKAASLNLVP